MKLYDMIMLDWNKAIIAEAFKPIIFENTEYTKVVAMAAQGININNIDIKLVIEWDLFEGFNSFIQWKRCDIRKNDQFANLLLMTLM